MANKAARQANFADGLKMLYELLNKKKIRDRKYILGFDISLSNTGFTVYDMEKDTFSSFSTKLKNGSRYMRMKEIEDISISRTQDYPPILAVIEGYAFGAKMYRELIGEVSYAVKRSLYLANTPSIIVAPGALKKFAVNKFFGSDKNEIIEAVRNKFKHPVNNGDEADSYILCRIGYHVYNYVKFIDKKATTLDDKQAEIMMKEPYRKMSPERWAVIVGVVSQDSKEMNRFIHEEKKKHRNKYR